MYLRAKGAAGARYRLNNGVNNGLNNGRCATRLLAQRAADVLVALVIGAKAHLGRGEHHLRRRAEKLLQLLDRAQPCLAHVDQHSCDD